MSDAYMDIERELSGYNCECSGLGSLTEMKTCRRMCTMCVYVEKTKIESRIETIERKKEKEASNDV